MYPPKSNLESLASRPFQMYWSGYTADDFGVSEPRVGYCDFDITDFDCLEPEYSAQEEIGAARDIRDGAFVCHRPS